MDRTICTCAKRWRSCSPQRGHPYPADQRLVLASPEAAVACGPSPDHRPARPVHCRVSSSAKTGASAKEDVLYAMHTTLHNLRDPQGVSTLGEGSRTEPARKHHVAEAYNNVACAMGGGWVGRIRWVGLAQLPVGVGIDQSKMSARVWQDLTVESFLLLTGLTPSRWAPSCDRRHAGPHEHVCAHKTDAQDGAFQVRGAIVATTDDRGAGAPVNDARAEDGRYVVCRWARVGWTSQRKPWTSSSWETPAPSRQLSKTVHCMCRRPTSLC
ncbi:hypothetical protein EDB84DRAFT_693180 [Lactarius hengduanensis]|nr:hypothetical protein EDB84DRAFT_693180 [Lactarius hengduanensis]